MNPVEQFTRLFRGRGDARGTWKGGSLREPLTAEHFEQHLTSPREADWIGVYPHLGSTANQSVTWGCIDIDGKDFELLSVCDACSERHTDDQYQCIVDGVQYGSRIGHDWDAMLDLARNLQTVLAVKHVYAHLERTRNGYHLWVFPNANFVPAAHMRRALMAACKAVGYAPKEVNPKGEELLPGRIGNYVRCAYPGVFADRPGLAGGPTGRRGHVHNPPPQEGAAHRQNETGDDGRGRRPSGQGHSADGDSSRPVCGASGVQTALGVGGGEEGGRHHAALGTLAADGFAAAGAHCGVSGCGEPCGAERYFLGKRDEPLCLPCFLDSVQLTSPATLREVAKLWTPPTTSVSLSDHDVPQDVEGVLTTVSGVAFTIWRDGPLEGRDRSNTLAKLAHTLASEGIQPGAAFAVLRDADRRWGKFADRPDCDEQLVKFIEAAYPDDPGMGHGPQPSEEAR